VINPYDSSDLRRLTGAIEADRKELRPFRDKRMDMLKQYKGTNYGDSGANEQKVPVNLLEQAISIYARAIVSSNPGVIVSSPHRELKPSAAMLQLATNQMIGKMNLERNLREWAMDAMFGMGVMKVGLKRTRDSSEIDPGQVYAECVPFDDYVHDTRANRLDQCRYFGNRYFISRDDLLMDGMINRNIVKNLPRAGQAATDDQGEDRSRSLSTGQNGHTDAGLEDQHELWDIYLVRENKLVTLELSTAQVLKVTHFDGPIQGPYHHMGFGDVPGNSMPLCPASLLLDLHDITNRLARKLARQAERQKSITGFAGGSEDDAERLRKANDGATERVDRQGSVFPIEMGGANPKTAAMVLQFKQFFSQMGGNIEALGGLGPQSDTLGQDQIISAGANQRLSEMQSRFIGGTARVCRDIAWYGWTDRLTSPTLSRRVPGSDIEIPVAWTPEERRGDFLDYNMEIDVYSMGPRTPARRLQSLLTLVEKFVIPLMPIAQAQGITLDYEMLIREAAACVGRRDVDTLFRFAAGAQNPAPGPSGPGMPASPTRTYERVSRQGGTSQGQESSMMRQMMGNDLQPSEADAAFGGMS